MDRKEGKYKVKKRIFRLSLSIALMLSFLLSGCSEKGSSSEYPTAYDASPSPLIEDVRYPSFPQVQTETDGVTALVDFSNASQGYFGVQRLNDNGKRIKVKVKKEGQEDYNYDLNVGMNEGFDVYPFQFGDGVYTISIHEHKEGTEKEYYTKFSLQVNVQLENEFIPFLYPSQLVDYTADSNITKKAFEITEGLDNDLARVHALYYFTVNHLKYDKQKAKDVQGKYVLPVLDEALETGKGICFDYASMLTAMCRMHDIPARLILGYTSVEYHAWVEVYLEGIGWINPKVEFKGEDWTLMDPTFESVNRDYTDYYDEVKRY